LGLLPVIAGLLVLIFSQSLAQTKFPGGGLVDSLKLDVSIANGSAAGIRQQVVSKVDSLQSAAIRLTSRIDTLRHHLTSQIDSANYLGMPAARLEQLLDSLNSIDPLQDIRKAEQKLLALERQVNDKISGVEESVNEKLETVNRLIERISPDGAMGIELPKAGLGELSLSETGMNSPVKRPEFRNPLEKMPGMPDPSKYIPAIPGLPDLPRVRDYIPEEVTEGIGDIRKYAADVSVYRKDVRHLANGDIDSLKQVPRLIESQLSRLEEMQGLQEMSGEAGKYTEFLRQAGDAEKMKVLALEQAKEFAIDHFAGQQEILTSAMAQMARIKARIATVPSMVDLPKRLPNAMHSKPLKERLLAGITVQFQQVNDLWTDLNPYLAYRLSGRFTAGLGWNYRVIVEKDPVAFPAEERIYGPRSFLKFRLGKGLNVRTDLELMSMSVPGSTAQPGAGDPYARLWSWGWLAGVTKEYRISRKLLGEVQFMYNLWSEHDRRPYASPFNLRAGFELVPGKRVRHRYEQEARKIKWTRETR
jgi:hypothetical protein